jgi:Flp pilus assembly protein TadD
MKKTTLTIMAAATFFGSGLKAQSIPEGMNHLYAGRVKSATTVFEKMLLVNPNNIDAIYWLGQAKLEADEIMGSRIAGAKQVYEKALQTTNGAPLIQVGMGHVELLENKANEARQHFETALTLTRHSKKGDDPNIETAIGRAIADSKTGDFQWAVRLLEDATTKDPKNTEAWLQLGNAHRKAGSGSGGGPAYTAYNKALQVNSNFAPASFRLAELFKSQKNYDFVLQYLNDAITKDPNFSVAYYELFYFYFFRQKFSEAEGYLNKYIASKSQENDVQDQYLYAQLCWAQKNWDCATTKAESVVTGLGNNTKPKVYRLLADAYFEKGDYANARKYSELFFQKKNPDDYGPYDHIVRAKILTKTGGTPDEIYDNYMQGAQLDSVLSSRIDFLKDGAAYFKTNKMYDKYALIMLRIIDLKPKAPINDYFDLMKSYYDDDKNSSSRDAAVTMRDKFPEQVFGYEWAFRNSLILDTTKRDSIAVPDALKLNEFAQKDTVKYKSQYLMTVRYLAGFYFNNYSKTKDKESALGFLIKWRDADPANAEKVQGYITQLEKMTNNPPPGTKPGTTPPSNKQPATKTPVKSSASKPAAAVKSKTTTKAVVKN